jgi:hypothetical protein
MPKLTKRFVESVKPAETDLVIFDDEIAGFGPHWPHRVFASRSPYSFHGQHLN